MPLSFTDCGLAGIALTGDAFNLYVLIEVAALTGYGLIALGTNRAAAAVTFNYVILGTIGASFYLLGVGYLYLKTGTLNMVGIQEVIEAQALHNSPAVQVAFVLVFLGILIKMAFFSHACLASQCLLPCTDNYIMFTGTSGDQGYDLCDDPYGSYRVWCRVFL